MFFSVLYKTTERSLRSFPCFIKEHCSLYGFISHTKIANLAKKNNVEERRVLFIHKVKKERNVLFSIYIYMYISIYIYLYLYISIYLLKKEWNVLHSFAKEQNVFTIFYVLCKRTLRSLRSFPLFRKERKRMECSFWIS